MRRMALCDFVTQNESRPWVPPSSECRRGRCPSVAIVEPRPASAEEEVPGL